jgi:hypothetical protein
LLCISTCEDPLFGEHRPDHRHFLPRRECREILAVERILIVFEPDDPNLHAAASLGGAPSLVGIRLVVHAVTFDSTSAKSYPLRARFAQRENIFRASCEPGITARASSEPGITAASKT